MSGLGWAWRGVTRQGKDALRGWWISLFYMAGRGVTGQGKAWQGTAWQGIIIMLAYCPLV